MEIHAGLESLPPDRVRRSVVTWGVFDGVHRGHQKVLRSLVEWARERGGPSLVITFDRHPAEVLHGRDVPLVTTVSQRLRLISECGVNHLLLLPFTKEFARTGPESFVRGTVTGLLGASGILLGHDSHFGENRAGDLALLKRLGPELGLEIRDTPPEEWKGRPLSSSLIRELIHGGRLEEAAELLGRPVTLSGTVVRGDGRGSKIGFPTANVELHHRIRPPFGVYAVEAKIGDRRVAGVANFGVRPTFGGGGEPVLEVHLLNYEGSSLYGRDVEVALLESIRGERKFSNVEELVRQIRDDIARVLCRVGR